MKRTVLLFSLLFGASSCASCESCGGGKKAGGDGGTATDAAATALSTPEPSSEPPPAVPSGPPMEPNFACRTLARAITAKACDCPQKGSIGCCYFGTPPAVPGAGAPYLDCSRGTTDWPANVETRTCKVGLDEKKKAMLMACYAAKDKLRCGRSPTGDLGAQVPTECEAFLREVTVAK